MFVFRRAIPTDAESLSVVAQETFQEGWASVIGTDFAQTYAAHHLCIERLHAEITDPDAHHFILSIDTASGAIQGYGKLDLKRSAHESVVGTSPVLLQRFYVSASQRGTGLADALLAACAQEAANRGLETLWLECDPRNERAWRFYGKRGFVARGDAIYHYPNGGYNDQIRIMERGILQDSSLMDGKR